MNNYLTRNGIKILMQLFFDEKKNDEWLAMSSLELQLELGVYDDIGETARIIEEEQAFSLLEKFKLYDVELVNAISSRLKKARYSLDN